ncbi:NlpC/P60 family protein [Enterococcus alishanensis]
MITSLAKLTKQTGSSLKETWYTWEKYGYKVDEVSKLVRKSMDKSRKNLDNFAKGTSEADMAWNAMALDPKTGEVKTNMSDMLLEIANAEDGWDQLEFLVKNADLTSNAKEEVAVAMGEAGKWDNLYFTEKLLLVNGDEAKIELYDTINELGQWNNYKLDRKELGVDNADAVWKLLDTETKVDRWNNLPVDQKEVMADNTDLVNKIIGSEQMYNKWVTIPDDQKKIFLDNSDLMNKVFASEESYNRWITLPDTQKNMLANNTDLASKVFASEEQYNAWMQLPDSVKAMLANNEDLKQKMIEGKISTDEYNKVDALLKTLNGDATNVGEASLQGKKAVKDWNEEKPEPKTFTAKFSAFIDDTWDSIKKSLNKKGNLITGNYARGTNFHPGGLALVNDQQGMRFKELVKLPDGRAFLPQERNTLLDLPRGSQVVKASLTKKMIPRYEDGIGGTVESVSTDEPIKKLIEAIDRLTNTLNGGKKQTIGGETSSVDSVQLGATNQQNLEAGSQWMGNLIDGWNAVAPTMYSTEATFIQTYKNQLLAENLPNYTQGVAWTTNLMNGWKYLVPTFLSGVDKLGNDSILNLQSKSPTFYSAGQFLIQSLINGIGSMGTSLNTTMNGVANKMVSGIGKGVNGVVAGVNHVLTQVESEKKLSNWTVPTYAKGTKAHPGGLALVNDQKGNNYEEYIQTPDGQGFIPEGRNVLADLPKGSKVMPATKTKRFKKLYDIPRYEEGIGDFDEIFDLIDDKSVFERIVNEKIKYDGMNGMYLNMTKSAVKLMTDKAYTFVKKIAEEMMVGTGDRAEFMKLVLAQQGKQYVWGAEGPDTFDCSGLIMWALKQIGINFPHYTGAQWNATEHISEKEAVPGDLIYFGPNAHRHVGMYTKPGEMFNASAPNAYGPGNGIGYSGYAAPDLWGFARIKELTGRGGMGSSRGRNFNGNWNNAIRAAAKQMRVQVTESDIANILSLIQHESGGNEKVIQSAGVWDINMANGNPARGLLQYIPSTFANYAVKGHNNIMSGYDQLLAFFNNKYWRTQFNPRGGWSPSGPRRYENGGLITKHGLFEGAEGNKPEMVIPLTRKTRAIELMGQVLAYLSGNSSNNSGTTQKSNDSTKLEDKLDQLIGIMSQFGSDLKNLKLEANERELATVVDHAQTKTALIQSKIRGDG